MTAGSTDRRHLVDVAVSLLFVGAVLSLAVPLLYLLPPGTTLLGFEMSTVHNAIVLGAVLPMLLTRGVRHRYNPVLLACALLLVISFTLSTRLPQLTALQSFKTFAALALGAFIFELRLDERSWRWLRAGIPLMALVNLAVSLLIVAATDRSLYRVDWGAVRLQGTVVPGHLAYLALGALLFSMLAVNRRPLWAWAVVGNLAVITWTGSRTAIFEGALLTTGWLAAEWFVSRRAGRRFWTLPRGAIAAALPLVLLSYLPFIANRMSSFHSHRAEGLVLRLPSESGDDSDPTAPDEEEEQASFEIYDDEGLEDETALLRISTTGRLRAWEFFWDVAQENPWFGRGLGAGVIASRGHLHESFRVPHNEYLRLVVDAGFVGMAIFFLAYLVQGLRVARATADTHGKTLVLLACVVLAADSLLRNPFAAQHFMIPFWLFLALCSTSANDRPGADQAATVSPGASEPVPRP